jgi:hypothetical protein
MRCCLPSPQYLQAGLGRSPLVSGLTPVPWVAAFGLAGQLVRRLPARTAAAVPSAGCRLLAAAYLAISTALFAGHHGELLLSVLLGAGGLGLGLHFSALTGHLTTAIPDGYASDISGVTSTTLTIGGAIGVAALGTLYLSLASHPGAGTGQSSHAYASPRPPWAASPWLPPSPPAWRPAARSPASANPSRKVRQAARGQWSAHARV